MREAILYSAKQELVRVYSDYIPYYEFKPKKKLHSYNSSDILLLDGESSVHQLGVERWIFNGVNHFVAFDPKLRDIIQAKIYAEVRDVRKELQSRIDGLTNENIRLQSRTLWDMICSKFKRNKK